MLQRKFPSALLTGMLAAGLLSPSPAALAGGTLRVAMTASDVPTTTGAPDNGYEGMRFLGFPVFEGLVLWDLSQADKLADIRPGLADKWEQDKEDKTKWIFHLRQGVKFHDGSDFNADAAIWNLDRYYKKDRRNTTRPARRSHRRAIRLSRDTAKSTITRSRSPIRGRSATSPTCCRTCSIRARHNSPRPARGPSSRKRPPARDRSRSRTSSRASAPR